MIKLLRPRGPAITDADLSAQAQRNAERAAQARARMGIRLCTHPANSPAKQHYVPVIMSNHHRGLFS